MIENPNEHLQEQPEQPAVPAVEADILIAFDFERQVVARVMTNNATIKSPHFAKAILQMALDSLDKQIKLAEVAAFQQKQVADAQAQALANHLKQRNGR